MESNKIKIETDGTTGHLFIGEHEIHGVRSIDFHIDSEDKVPIVTVDLLAIDTTIDSPCVKLREKNSRQGIDEIVIDGKRLILNRDKNYLPSE